MNTLIITLGINPPEKVKEFFDGEGNFELRDENILRKEVDYVDKCYRMVSEYLEHTEFDILVGTNEPDRFKDLGPRVQVIYKDQSIEDYEHNKAFKEYTKLEMIAEGYELGYDIHYWIDADNGTDGWDQDSWNQLCMNKGSCVWGNTQMNRTQLAIWSYATGDWQFHVHSFLEDRIIFTDRKKLKAMIDLWMNEDKWNILFKHTKWKAMGGTIGVIIGESVKEVGASYRHLKAREDWPQFCQYERVYHKKGDKKLCRWWQREYNTSEEPAILKEEKGVFEHE